MSIEQPHAIDRLAVDPVSATCTLTIIDHLAWDEPHVQAHLQALQAKINRCLQFIQSGEIFIADPDAADCELVIVVRAIHAPTMAAEQFIEAARSVLEDAGIGLSILPFGSAYAGPMS